MYYIFHVIAISVSRFEVNYSDMEFFYILYFYIHLFATSYVFSRRNVKQTFRKEILILRITNHISNVRRLINSLTLRFLHQPSAANSP